MSGEEERKHEKTFSRHAKELFVELVLVIHQKFCPVSQAEEKRTKDTG